MVELSSACPKFRFKGAVGLSHELIIDLIVNIAVYCMAAVLIGRVIRRFEDMPSYQRQLAVGVVLGVTALVGMMAPVNVMEGIIFDGRAIAVAAAGLFGGPFGAAAAIIPPALYRIDLGGAGVIAGVVNILLSAGLGLSVRHWAKGAKTNVGVGQVFLVACLLPFASYIAFAFFPTLEIGWAVFQKVGLVIAIFIPAGFILLGLLLVDEESRHQLVLDLRLKETLFNAMHSDIPAMLFQRVMDKHGMPDFRYISPSAKRLLDKTPEEIYRSSQAFLDAIHPEDRDHFLKTIRAAEAEGKLPNHEYRSVSREGFVRWLRVNASSTLVDGEYVWNGVTIDITAQKVSERRLSELAQMVSDAAVAIIRTDAEFNVRYFNEAAEKLYGYSAKEVMGSPAAMFRPPEMIEVMAEFLGGLQERSEPGSKRTLSLHKTGKRVPTRLDFSPLFDQNHELSGWAVMCIDMTEQQAAEDELQRLASTDMLTGLANRRAFDERADEEIARARRYKRPLAVIIADIDHFKGINDTYGHDAGDQVLIAISNILADCLRNSGDIIARIGGEEFAILLPECDQDGAALLAERLRISIAAFSLELNGDTVKPTSSFGVSEWHQTEGRIDEAQKRADAALYLSKTNGRNRVTLAEPKTTSSSLVSSAHSTRLSSARAT